MVEIPSGWTMAAIVVLLFIVLRLFRKVLWKILKLVLFLSLIIGTYWIFTSLNPT